jgi:hypothetical protein
MLNNDLHLSDQELLLAADGELPRKLALRARLHLAACWTCRARMGEIERTIADFVRLHEDDIHSPSDLAAGPRAMLKARLAELAAVSRPGPSPLWLGSPFAGRVAAGILAVLLFGAVGIWKVNHRQSEPKSERALAGFEPSPLPNRSLTPGATRPVTKFDVCAARHSEAGQTVPAPLQQKVLQEYGMVNAQPGDYELDHLITPELGGSDDPGNLWPEPHSAVVWNSYVKDELEDHLHAMVCDGTLDLATAQHDIATDWIAAYKKYFHTDRPFRIHSGLA